MLIAKDLGGEFVGIGGYLPEGGGDGTTQLASVVTNVFGFLTIAAGLSFIIYFAIGGLNWITSGGDKNKVEEAKSRMTGAAIGMIIIVVTYGIVWIVGKVLGFDILDPATTIQELDPNKLQ